MRELKLTSLVFLAGLAIAACGSDDGGDDDGNTPGTGVGNVPGAGGTGGPGTGLGGGTSTPANACPGDVAEATGSPAMIDDFEGDPADGLPENDGRVGEWHFGNYTDSAGPIALFEEDPADPANKAMHLSMDNAGLEVTPWDPEDAWGQWASASTGLQPWVAEGGPNCYDASVHTGIRFRAMSGGAEGDRVRVDLGIPGANVDAGETHQSEVLSLGGEWETFEIPFTAIKQPSWVSGAGKVEMNPAALVSIAFVVRSVQDEADGETLGESLLDFDIWIDDVEFY